MKQKKCPACKKKRPFDEGWHPGVPRGEGRYARSGVRWKIVDGRWVCGWCVKREEDMMKEPSYVVALIMKDGLCLSASRRNKPGNLGLPGGSIEPTDESTFAALAREVMEETGVTVLAAHHVFSRVDDTDGNVAWCYVVDEWEGEPKNREPGIDVSWEKPGRLLQEGCSFRDYNKRLFEKIGLHILDIFDPLVSVTDEEYAKMPQLTAEERAKTLEQARKDRSEAEAGMSVGSPSSNLRIRS